VLRNLTRNLARAAPTQLRVGGGAADSLLFTGAGSRRLSLWRRYCCNAEAEAFLNVIVGVQLPQSIATAEREYSREKTPLPGAVSAHRPSGTP